MGPSPPAATGRTHIGCAPGKIDLDVALNNSAGAFAQDSVFAVCNQGGGTGYS
jgi:hypothetical protein